MRSILVFGLIVALSVSASAGDKPPPVNSNLKSIKIHDLDWSADLASALEQAAKNRSLVFIDFTGESCVNCRINEKSVFVKEDVQALFKKYVRVQIYTDAVPDGFYKESTDEGKRENDAAINQKFQKKAFNTEQLPLYVIVKPADGGQFEIVGAYGEGKINKVDKFLEFLKKPVDGK